MKPIGGEFYELSQGKEPGWQNLLHSSSSKLSYFSPVSVRVTKLLEVEFTDRVGR